MHYGKYLLGAALLSGCASSSQLTLPDGSRGYALNCSGLARSWNMCLKRAGELCPQGYELLYRDDSTNRIVTASPGYENSLPVLNRTILAKCKSQ